MNPHRAYLRLLRRTNRILDEQGVHGLEEVYDELIRAAPIVKATRRAYDMREWQRLVAEVGERIVAQREIFDNDI
jgi:hypothetical protein